MRGKIAIVAFCDDGLAREVLLSPIERHYVQNILKDMFPDNAPISKVELPLELSEKLWGEK